MKIKLADRMKVSTTVTGGDALVPPGLKGVVFFDITEFSGLSNVTLDVETASDADPVSWVSAATSGTKAATGTERDVVGDFSNGNTFLGERIRWKATPTGTGYAVFSIVLYVSEF